jgi:hypothetical protein
MKCPEPIEATLVDPKLTVVQAHTVVLFDPATGKIEHVHQVAQLAGGMRSTAAQREAAAKANLARMRPNATRNIGVLHLAGFVKDSMCQGMTYKVVNCALVPG